MASPQPQIYRAGPYSSRNHSIKTPADIQYKHTVDVLYKDIEKKENRNVSLLKEVQTLRAEYANQARELKITKNMFEKMNKEKQQLFHEVQKLKEYNNRLESALERLEDPQKLIDRSSGLQIDLESTIIELQQSYVALRDREDQILSLQQDVEVLQRTLEVKAEFEGKASSGTGREAMRSLYFELGKRQADCRSLSLSLAESNESLKHFQQHFGETQAEAYDARARLAQLHGDTDILAQQVGGGLEHAGLRFWLTDC